MAVKRAKFENVLFYLFIFAFAVFLSHPPPPPHFSPYRCAYDIGAEKTAPTNRNILFSYFYYVYGARKIRLLLKRAYP